MCGERHRQEITDMEKKAAPTPNCLLQMPVASEQLHVLPLDSLTESYIPFPIKYSFCLH